MEALHRLHLVGRFTTSCRAPRGHAVFPYDFKSHPVIPASASTHVSVFLEYLHDALRSNLQKTTLTASHFLTIREQSRSASVSLFLKFPKGHNLSLESLLAPKQRRNLIALKLRKHMLGLGEIIEQSQ